MTTTDLLNENIKVEVLVSTQKQMSAEGAGCSKWFVLTEYDNHADFFNAALDHVQNVWGEKNPSIEFTHIHSNISHLSIPPVDTTIPVIQYLGLITKEEIDADLWLLLKLDKVEQVEKVKAFINIYDKQSTMQETIESAINLFQGRHDSDESCVEQYISEFGSIEEADPDISPDLTKEEYTAHFMKQISKSNGYYFNN